MYGGFSLDFLVCEPGSYNYPFYGWSYSWPWYGYASILVLLVIKHRRQRPLSERGGWSDRFHDLFDVLIRAVFDLLEFWVLAEFSKVSFNQVEEFVNILQKPCEFSTNLSCVQS